MPVNQREDPEKKKFTKPIIDTKDSGYIIHHNRRGGGVGIRRKPLRPESRYYASSSPKHKNKDSNGCILTSC